MNIQKRNSVLVTGANGLIGRAVVERLSESEQVFAVVKDKPVRAFPTTVQVVLQDLNASLSLGNIPAPETIIHLAQSPHYREFPDNALDVFEVNVGSTQRLLEWAYRHGVKRFIFASSGGVYGAGPVPFEEHQPLGSNIHQNHYITSKRCGELLVESYRREMTIIVLRFFFVYGSGQRPTMLIRRLVDNVRSGRPIKLDGRDGIRLNPVYVDDAAAAIESALELETGETINVAGPQVLTMRRIGELIGEATGCLPRFEVESGVKPEDLVGSIRKMAALLRSPRIDMGEGLRRMLAASRAGLMGFDAR